MNDFNHSCSLNTTGVDQLVWKVGAFFFPVLGLPGHVLMISTVLNSYSRNFHPISFYFVFIAIFEMIYLIFFFWDWLDVVNIAPDPRKILDCAFFYPFVNSSSLISLILVTQMNFDRISMIRHPQTSRFHLTSRKILLKIALTSAIAIPITIHYRFSLTYDPNAFIIFGQSCRVYSQAHRWFYSIWPYLHFFCYLIPCILLILFTAYICLNRHNQISSRTRSIHRRQKTFSLVLVVVSIYTLLATLPIMVLQLFNRQMSLYQTDFFRYNCESGQRKANNWKLLNAVFIMCEASSFTCKFYIRCMFSLDFRQDFKRMIVFRFERFSRPDRGFER